MNAQLRAQVCSLREEVRQFCRESMPAQLLEKSHRHQVLDKADYVQWMKLLHQRGWAAPHWPAAYGGADWTPLQRFVLEDELARQGCPWIIPFGVKYVGPVIYAFGNEEQKARFLPNILSTDEFWAQGYSEPNAGSDLAGLKTQAVRDGDHYIVNGQKVWTTYAQWADWLFCLVRTSHEGKPQAGISFLLIDMQSPGISVNEIKTMDGYRHVNEVWLENVRVPVSNLIGVEGGGWNYAKFLLKNERTAGAIVGQAKHVLERLKQFAYTPQNDQRPIERPALRHTLANFELRFMALEAAAYDAVEAMMLGHEDGGEASIIKIRGTELYQEVSETLVEAMGMAGVAFDPQALHAATLPPLGPDDAGGIIKEHFYNRAATIFGGSSEVQRNILAKVVLGL